MFEKLLHQYNTSIPKLANFLGLGWGEMQTNLKYPLQFTIHEVRRIADYLNIPQSDLIEIMIGKRSTFNIYKTK